RNKGELLINGSLHGWRDIRASDDENGKTHKAKEAGGEGRGVRKSTLYAVPIAITEYLMQIMLMLKSNARNAERSLR
ncbi:MAG TPA: hypothetical protein GXZ26_10905, partial [Firmicutes bacterium]|nr:hypothetical protein [Bacillota bacterium]